METALWIVQTLLAALFLATGMTKLTQPRLKMAAGPMAWAEDVTDVQFRTVGLLEVLGALGLILPRGAGHRAGPRPARRHRPRADHGRRDRDPRAAGRDRPPRGADHRARPGAVRRRRALRGSCHEARVLPCRRRRPAGRRRRRRRRRPRRRRPRRCDAPGPSCSSAGRTVLERSPRDRASRATHRLPLGQRAAGAAGAAAQVLRDRPQLRRPRRRVGPADARAPDRVRQGVDLRHGPVRPDRSGPPSRTSSTTRASWAS